MTPIEIDTLTTKSLLKEGAAVVLIDCRDPEEYATARIEGARLVPMSEIGDRLAELEPHKADQVIVHCHHGGRSLRVAMWLRQQGFSRAQSMAGGIDDWSQRIDSSVPRY